MGRCAFSTLSVRGSAAGRGELLGHHDFGAARPACYDVEFIHKRAHQENSTPGSAEQIFFRERVWHIRELEACAFIDHVDDHFIRCQVDGEIDLFLRALLISVMKRVDHALAHAHPDAVTIIFAKARCFRDAQTQLLCQVDALHLRLQRNFKVLGVRRHFALLLAPGARILALYG
jgi:hypothetical protein